MAKFNYKKWVTENKHGKLSEYRDENPFNRNRDGGDMPDDPNDPRNFGRFEEEALGSDTPIGMSDLDADLAKLSAKSGQGKGSPDETQAKINAPVAVGSLSPAQKEVIAEKALCFALGFLRDGTPDLENMEAIVSSDMYIMDGHHRWAARTLIDPGAKVMVAKVEMPADELITALNVYTKGIANIQTGNQGSGAISAFKSSIPKLLDTVIAEGTIVLEYPKGPWPKLTAEEVKTSLGKVPGANGDFEKGKELMKANANKLKTEIHPNAPSRVDMPVIDAGKGDLTKVINKLKTGAMDIKPGYSNAVKAKLGGEKTPEKQAAQESIDPRSSLYERMEKLINKKN